MPFGGARSAVATPARKAAEAGRRASESSAVRSLIACLSYRVAAAITVGGLSGLRLSESAFDHAFEDGKVQRFGNILIHAGREAFLAIPGECVRGHCDH